MTVRDLMNSWDEAVKNAFENVTIQDDEDLQSVKGVALQSKLRAGQSLEGPQFSIATCTCGLTCLTLKGFLC